MSKESWQWVALAGAVLFLLAVLFWQSEKAVACHKRGGIYAKTWAGGYKCLREEKL